jgi:hypothetical protein
MRGGREGTLADSSRLASTEGSSLKSLMSCDAPRGVTVAGEHSNVDAVVCDKTQLDRGCLVDISFKTLITFLHRSSSRK